MAYFKKTKEKRKFTQQNHFIIGKDGKVVGSGGGAPGIGGNFTDAPAADGSPIVTITPGHAPRTGPGQLVIDDKSAATSGLPARRHRSSWSPPVRSPR